MQSLEVSENISIMYISVAVVRGGSVHLYCSNEILFVYFMNVYTTGVIIILAVLIFYKKKAGLRPSHAPETSDGDPDWALFLSTSGALIAMANSVLITVAVKRYSRKNIEKFKTIFGIYAAGRVKNVILYCNSYKAKECPSKSPPAYRILPYLSVRSACGFISALHTLKQIKTT